jgi:spermidine synthase
MQLLFAITVFLAAALLFVVEPMFARMALPLLGGAPAVWNTAMVFYQAALLAGYGLAHLVATRLSPRRQALAQILLVAVPLALLPLGIGAGWTPPAERNPIPWLLVMMTATVGLPFLALSTLSPILQRWFAASGARNPYWLYAASNAGSLIGLLAYPVLIEPWLGLRAQSCWWSAGYVALAALVAVCAVVLWRCSHFAKSAHEDTALDTSAATTARQRFRWVLLAAAPSSLMLSVTTHLSTEVAAMPLLWVVPLAIYLVTFILVFAERQWIKPHWMIAALPWVVLPLTVIYGMRAGHKVALVGGWNLLALFVGAMVCHGRLAAERPPAARLTEFYWWMSVGGALGGAFNALLAPVLFRWVVEYPVSVALVCLLASRLERPRWTDVAWPVALGVGGWALGEWVRQWPAEAAGYAVLLKLSVPAVAAWLLRKRALQFGLAVAALFAAATWLPGEHARVLTVERSFFGVHRVRVDAMNEFHRLEHGTTVHGVQSVKPDGRGEPLGYYSRTGPVGQLFAARRRVNKPLRNVGAVGLGAGAVAAYAEPGETWTFFEIDPVVERIARELRYFTHLADCRGEAKVTLGDARLTLQRTSERFDALVLDAYSSDAIPLHLLTREAVRLYLERLERDGWLIFHFSNRHLKLEPVLAALARDAGLACRVQVQDTVSAENRARGVFASSWAVMCREEAYLGFLLNDLRWRKPEQRPKMRLWTDDYASILSVWR